MKGAKMNFRYLGGASMPAMVLFGQAAMMLSTSAKADEAGSDIIVTGTRTADKTRLDASSPVDVIKASTLRERGTTELAAALGQIAPSIDFPRAAMVGGTDSIRPATLRGLSPDQVLVLINGVRGHTSALLNINGSIGRGAAAVDLNTIPITAIESVEVLRDGASAQYGSDAIAGVVNLRLREARSGGAATVSYGKNLSHVDTPQGERNVHDGGALTVSGWQGFALGSEGFLTISGEYSKRNHTNRSDYDVRVNPAVVTSRFGDPDVEQGTGYVNVGVPVGEDWQLYGWLGYQHRTSEAASFYRLPGDLNNVTALYPEGLLPLTKITSKDLNSSAGLRGTISDWSVDLNLSYGSNKLDFNSRSVAPTYGAASPTRFYLGALFYDQAIAGLDVTRAVPIDGGNLNIAFGAEYRREGFKIEAGQEESYSRGPLGSVNTSLQSGAVGFLGFEPDNAVDVHRSNASLYADIEAKFDNGITVGVAGRGERYSDFGTTATGKLSGRYDAARWLAFRGTFSTGFRAPSLQQSWYTSTQSVALPAILETGTYPSLSPIAVALGGKRLEPEKSTSLSAGVVLRSGSFNLTVDGYRIHIRNQLALSENIQASASTQIAAILAPYGVQAARFFINGITSTTTGIDVVAEYAYPTSSLGTFNFGLGANFNRNKLDKIPTSTAVLSPAPVLYGHQRQVLFEKGTPSRKISGTVDWKLGGFGATGRVTYYGSVTSPGATAAQDTTTGDRAIVDLEVRQTLGHGLQIALGADNILDTYPRQLPPSIAVNGVIPFSYSSPFGFNGRYVYGRIGLNW